MTQPLTNVAASVRVRLKRIADAQGEDFQLVLTRYACERLLYRLATSRHAGGFILKGAALFMAWTSKPHRATRDVDLLGSGDPADDRMLAQFRDVFSIHVVDDGLRFDAESLTAGAIREDQRYGGVRISGMAFLDKARIPLQIDIGFGDAVTPAAVETDFPTLLEFPAPRLLTYPRETVVAEKLEAIVQLGLANSRMKDYYDLIVLSRIFEFNGAILARAIRATFDRRGTALPMSLPIGLSADFAGDTTKSSQWRGFLSRSAAAEQFDLSSVVETIAAFAWPAMQHASHGDEWTGLWSPGGAWTAGG